jgi:hypothetical protein
MRQVYGLGKNFANNPMPFESSSRLVKVKVDKAENGKIEGTANLSVLSIILYCGFSLVQCPFDITILLILICFLIPR